MKQLELNEYIESFKEIKPQLDLIAEDLNVEVVSIVNNGCKESLVYRIAEYLENHDIKVVIEGVSC